MRLRIFCCAGLVCAAVTLRGADTRLPTIMVGAKSYTNVVVLGVNATDLYFRYDGGISNVKLKYLSPELQKQFNFDAETSAEAEKQQLLDEARYAETLAQQIEAEVRRRAPKDELPPELTLADAASERTFLNKRAPEIEVEKWLGEKPAMQGKFVLVSFWATWSAPCRRFIPEFNAYHKKYADRLTIIGITSEAEKTVGQMTDPKMDYFSAVDSKARLSGVVGVGSVPYVLFIDPKGSVRYQGHPAAITDRYLQAMFKRYAPE